MMTNAKRDKRQIINYKETIAYLFWGGMTTIVCWGTYALFVKVFSCSVGMSNLLSWIAATIFAFVTNKILVFESKSWNTRLVINEFSKFVSSRLATGLLEIVLVPLLVIWGFDYTFFNVDGAAAKITVSILVVILNYIISKIFIFKK